MSKQLFKRGFKHNNPSAKRAHIDVKPIMLDEEQRSAVETKHNKVLVIAGAGSGKTRVLTERVKHLLETGVSPCNIVAITFTNLAADEMKERLKSVDGIGDCFIGTIHSFANKIMGLSGESYIIYNDAIDLEYHEELIEKYCKFLTLKRYLKYRDLLTAAERGEVSKSAVDTFFAPSEAAELFYIERPSVNCVSDVNVKKNYPECIQSLCKERGVITFDELLKKATAYFKSLDAYPEHVLVDEFQDVGPLECGFLKSLNAENYFYVGDDYQAIYGFKGGNVNLFFALNKSKHWTKYYLLNNYRNPRAIVELGDKIMSQVKNKIEHHSNILSDVEGSINVVSRYEGKPLLVESLKSLSRNELRNTFVLTYSNKELFELKRVLEYNDIPHSTFKREGMSLADINYVMGLSTVKLITVHTAKGLEADNVHLWGNFPITAPPYMVNEDSRKVMYVGVTRARKNLTIYN